MKNQTAKQAQQQRILATIEAMTKDVKVLKQIVKGKAVKHHYIN